MQDNFVINVDSNEPDLGKRLDLFLALKLSDYSRSLIKRTIESNQVFINGQVNFKAGYKVASGDTISFPKINIKSSFTELEPSPFDLEILYEDNDYLFINKPIGLNVHPANTYEQNTLANKLLSRYKDLPGENLSRPGIVHRLDKDTSGVIVIAKNPKSLWWISGQFANRKVTKKYLSIGISESKPLYIEDGKEFEISGFMKRSSENRKLFSLFKDDLSGTRYSLSKFRVLKIQHKNNFYFGMFEIFPKTGRTHQIRVHQKSFNMPILGDKIYLSNKQKKFSDSYLEQVQIPNRMFLHAHSIFFENYNGKIYSIESPVPKMFTEII